MTNKYPNLLSPIKIGNVIFKNRMTASPSQPRFAQGTEEYPTEALITHFANKARNGAAWVTCGDFERPVKIEAQKYHVFGGGGYVRHRMVTDGGTIGNFATNLETYLSQLTEAVHFYGSKASICIRVAAPHQYDVSAGLPVRNMSGDTGIPKISEELPAELLEGIADEFALEAAFVKDLGFDGTLIHMCYRGHLLARFLSPLLNKRSDEFGGGPENRARFPIMVADRIKQKCGQDFILEAAISGTEEYPGGQTLEDTIEFARLFSGHFDILQLRSGDMDPAHPTSYNLERTPFLYMAEAVKNSDAKIAVLTIGGYLDLGICEDVIASGKADFIGMARAWISNPDYGRLAYEGRSDDVVPCLRCNRCILNTYTAALTSVCSVNPTWGLEHKIERMIDPPTTKKNIAVVGGGPAGMEATLIAAGRGHQVTLYEKSDTLGGLLKTSNYPSFKWTLRIFKNYLIRQINKSNVMVHLNTVATPEMLKTKKYDAVFVAVGAEPIVPDIPGVNANYVVFAQDVYGNETYLAENVVVIGGGETGMETGMHLAENGHKVTVLEQIDTVGGKSAPVHYYGMVKEAWDKTENLKYIVDARCTSIVDSKVTYLNAEDKEQSIPADSVVIAVGYKPKNDLAMKFANVCDRFFVVGDCDKVGNIQTVMRSAYSNACMI